MNHSKQRFDFQIKKITTLLENAKSQENPALWLYLNDFRTPVFMVEGLAKMFSNLHDKKDFSKIKEQAKQVEDALGAVDYYIAFKKEFSTNAKIPDTIKKYIDTKANEKIDRLNQLLENENWLNGKRIVKIEKRLSNADWQKEDKLILNIKKYYDDEIKEIIDFTKATNFTFDNIEEDVHELRRKLRWLSIYVQALSGFAKLVPTKNKQKSIEKYLTQTIINSPFNQLKPDTLLTQHLQFNKDNFLALSWMIAELGNIKDEGLRIKILEDAYQETEFLKTEDAELKAMSLLAKKQPKMTELLKQASVISKTYFTENLLTNLIIKN